MGLVVRFGRGRTSSGRLPLALDASLHLRIDILVNGTPVSAILDSGVSRSVLDRGLVQSLSLQTKPGFRGASITDDVQGELVEGLQVDVGALTLAGITGAVLDLSRFATVGDAPVQLLLGREVFQSTLVELDLPGRHVEFFSRDAYRAMPGAALLPLRANDRGGRHLPVSINGGVPVEASFDLGCGAPLLMSPDFAAQSNVLANRTMSTSASLGAEGMVISRVTSLESLHLGHVRLDEVPVEIPNAWNRESRVVVGLPVFSRFNVVTDYTGDQITLRPDAATVLAPFPKDRSGIGARRLKNGFKIVHVALGSPAMSAGLREGDEIVAVDDQEIDDHFFKSNMSIGTRPIGTALRLKLSDGRTTNLILRDYY
jgi:predicted aspartyl protease